ncbi:MAG: hypothetical protein KKD90_00960 [Candidatus Omnitrophica bacterium]|nr:hypothetical protein [Candidatus Omnitrophota bacterium]MBU4149917.1 hypothetical protein [Candidatus Omnitrophota bacterium]
MKKQGKLRHIIIELGGHLPYSIFGVVIGIMIMGILTFFAAILGAGHRLPGASEELFHIFHPTHILLSALVTTAMFWKHDRHFIKTLVIGFAGSIAICGISDILLPYLGGRLLGTDMRLHLCILEHPRIIITFAITGVAAGFLVPSAIEKSTEFSHSMHVLVSSMASILYLISFGIPDWTHMIGEIFLITIIAVMLPCCMSDIVFPLSFIDHKDHCQ